MTNVIVIGKREIRPDEYDALHLLGYAIAHVGNELHTTPTPGAPRAVADGYELAGKTPHMHTAQLAQVKGDTICVLDRDLADRLTKVRPGWDDDPTWTLLSAPYEVLDFADITAGWLEATGRSLVESGTG